MFGGDRRCAGARAGHRVVVAEDMEGVSLRAGHLWDLVGLELWVELWRIVFPGSGACIVLDLAGL